MRIVRGGRVTVRILNHGLTDTTVGKNRASKTSRGKLFAVGRGECGINHSHTEDSIRVEDSKAVKTNILGYAVINPI